MDGDEHRSLSQVHTISAKSEVCLLKNAIKNYNTALKEEKETAPFRHSKPKMQTVF